MQVKQTSFRLRRTLLASAISLALAGVGGFAIAGQTGYQSGSQAGEQHGQPSGMMEEQAQAGEDTGMMQQEELAMGGQQIDEQKARDLLGKPLINQNDEVVGTVDRVVRDDQDQLALVVTEEGGTMLGMGEGTQRVVTTDQIEIEEHAALSQQAEDLAQMPEFDEQQYETIAQAQEQQQQQQPQDEQAEITIQEEEQDQAALEEEPQWGEDTQAQEQPLGTEQPGQPAG